MFEKEEYIHPESDEVDSLIKELQLENKSLSDAIRNLLRWFDNNISYSRLNSPYYPLQRSDLDVLKMKSGTCGDYSNLVVSVLTRLGYKAQYAYVHVDCYGNPQDHICAAVWNEGRWQLIDATLPYRKWHGQDCRHIEYDLLSYDDMKATFDKEGQYWTNKALEWGKESYAGLLYAPWIHEEIVLCNDSSLETVFFLLIMDSVNDYNIYAYYLTYSDTGASAVITCRVCEDGIHFRFPAHPADSLWDEKQWGEEYAKGSIPECFDSDRLSNMFESLNRVVPIIKKILDS